MENQAGYFVPAQQGEGKYTEKMSRFLAFAIPVDNAEEARDIVKAYTNKYHDARHVCWAYMLGPARADWQLNDNGEPSGTAGKPILGQINSFGLTNVLVIVVRYFGGIKLGTSGLIAAYREAARLALEEAGSKECFQMKEMSVTFPYISMNGVMKIVKSMPASDLEILSQTFDNTCEMQLLVRLDLADAVAHRLADLDSVMVSYSDSAQL